MQRPSFPNATPRMMQFTASFHIKPHLYSSLNGQYSRVRYVYVQFTSQLQWTSGIPRTMSEAESTGWRRIEGPPVPLPELMLYCTAGRYRLVRWHAPATDTEPARDYWTATQYYVSEASLKAGAGPQVENGDTLQDGGVWVKDLEGQLIRIPSTEAELSKTLFKKQNCYPKMASLQANAGPRVENGVTLQDGGVWVNDLEGQLIRIPSTEAELSRTLCSIQWITRLPRTMSEAESSGWRRIARPPGPLPELRLYCTAGRYVCPLFDTAGFVAGLQIGFPVEEFDSPTIKPEKRLVRWHAPATDSEPARDYWTATQYYVSEGTHYYWNMTREKSCDELLPWFPLVTNHDLLVMPYAPECLLQLSEHYSIISLHVYFINDPWNIKCTY
ncbi:unnamed protein product [Leptidea sinapis]|uniref:Uncharacterized protein n=1 Tax=Leptidea sinapis TaxID=189913 RepID=A0A5E4PTY6_9NEOP|nr:unnamed protein product [Leptidea sinapis]